MITPRQFDIIKHDRFMDVCFQVYSFKKYSPNYYTVKGIWMNMLFEKSEYISLRPIIIKIKNEELANWKLAVNDNLQCFRYSKWRKII